MSEMNLPQIHALPKHVSDKIAAGEVVDRPLSIVKELMENAIDAGATSITVEIRNGGKSYIRITDDGCGIAKDQVMLAFQRHATSKIETAEDLDTINTLGFRGEALASIAAVSQVEMITKPAAAKAGVKVRLQGGEVMEQTDTGCPDGTTIIVTSLFYNVPARLKFLKGDNTESSLIIDFVSKMALAYSKIRIRMINNGNILFNTPGGGQMYNNILTIYSKETGQKLLPISADNGSMFLEGYISDPSYSKTNRKQQIFFVNGRYIQSRMMEKAIAMAYKDKLFDGRYPVAYLFLYVNPETLDVNIHPNKKEVRFDDELAVLDFVHSTLRTHLNTKQAIPEVKADQLKAEKLFTRPEMKEVRKIEQEKQQQLSLNDSKTATPHVLKTEVIKAAEKKEVLKEQLRPKTVTILDRPAAKPVVEPTETVKLPEKEDKVDIKQLLKTMRQEQSLQKEKSPVTKVHEEPAVYAPAPVKQEVPVDKPVAQVTKEPVVKMDFTKLKVTGTLFNTYISATDGQFFYLIDQHAAHERVFYEQLLAQYEMEEKPAQILMIPIVKEVTPAIQALAGQWLDVLRGYGFTVEEFGQRSYVIKAIPLMMDQSEAGDFLDYFFDNIEEGFRMKDQKRIDQIIMRSCKQAIKANDALEPEEIKSLLAQLSTMENPFSCPHGRPTFIKFSKYEIEKMFKRV
ncbi:MAG: DNA mismatch repair endonuclease MutL [Firmicutes bacterium]|nr:DNA mismatch repair endonuclease MutL [Bacillota bacterium]